MPNYKIKLFNQDIDLDWMTRSNKKIEYGSSDSQRRLESSWDYEMYRKINMDTNEDEKVLYNTTTEIFNLYDVLMKPFMAKSITEIRQNFKNPDPNKVKEALLEAKFILRDLTGVTNINVAYAMHESASPNKKNISFFIDYLYSNIEEDFKINNPLDFEYVKGGFYMFKNPSKVMLTVIITADVLLEILNNRATNENVAASMGVYSPELNVISFTDSNLKVSLTDLRKEFAKAFISDFRFALYQESFRECQVSKLLWYLRMYTKVVDALDDMNLSEEMDGKKLLGVIRDSVENFVESKHPDNLGLMEDTIGLLGNLLENNFSEVHPLRLLTEFSNPHLHRSGSILKQLNMPHLNNYNLVNATSSYWVTTLEDGGDPVTNTVLQAICYKRLIPWSLLSISLSVYRSRKLKLNKFISETNEELITTLKNTDTVYNSTSIQVIADELRNIEAISKKIGNPLVEKILTSHNFEAAVTEYAAVKIDLQKEAEETSDDTE